MPNTQLQPWHNNKQMVENIFFPKKQKGNKGSQLKSNWHQAIYQ